MYSLITKSIFLVLILTSMLMAACSVNRGFEALEVYNYFQAKKYFERANNKDLVAAKYGLSIIQQRTDNPFTNLDTAYSNVSYSVVYFDSLTERKQTRYSEIGVTKLALLQQKDLIVSEMYSRAVLLNSEDSFQNFIDLNADEQLVSQAVLKRDSLGFNKATSQNTAEGYQVFMKKYADSKFYSQAEQRYERQIYAEKTKGNNLTDYIDFIREYPSNPFVKDAENNIYIIETEGGTAEGFELFIKRHPNNINTRKAWSQLYDAYLTENNLNSATITSFIERYPDNPFVDNIVKDLELSKTRFYPVQNNGLWNYKSDDSQSFIDVNYDFVEPFSEGLAAVVSHEKMGYITKSGDVKIDIIFDDALPFSEGAAVVEIEGKYGLINRQGTFLVMPDYDYLGALHNGLISFEKSGLFGYFDNKGSVKIKPIFDEAYDFNNGFARVSNNKKWGVINTMGKYTITPRYTKIVELTDTIFAVENGQFWGALSVNNDTVLDFIYDYISPPSMGMYMVIVNDSFNYTDGTGALLLKNNWQPIYPFCKILAAYNKCPILVYTESGYNYMNIDGSLLYKTGYTKLGTYSSLISFEKEGKWGYLSALNKKIAINPKFDRAFSFDYGYGLVYLAPFIGMINTKGEFIIDAYYEELNFITHDLIIAKGKGEFGLINTMGDTVLSFSSQLIEPFEENVVKLSDKSNVSYYNYISNTWIRKEE